MSQLASEPQETTQEAKKGGVPNQAALYSKVASKQDKILSALFEMLDSRNENIRLGAAKALINKILPDLKSTELTGQNGEPIKINFITPAAYFSAIGKSAPASTGSTSYGFTAIQSTDLAQESEKDDNSDKSDSSVESA